MTYILAILALGLLMVIHEGGHHLAARAFHMRVTKFSIGFGPTIWRHKPVGSDTTYQIAIIPFLAYVQIDGMNPLEEVDPNDRGSYANASVLARIVTIFAGPLANYLFASVLFFASALIGGKAVVSTSTRIEVVPNSPAAAAHVQTGDRVVSVAGKPVQVFEDMRQIISSHANQEIDLQVERDGQIVDLKVTPKAPTEGGSGRIGVTTNTEMVPVRVGEAAVIAVKAPARVVVDMVVNLASMISGHAKLDELSGPIGIVRATAQAVKGGLAYTFSFLGMLSAYLGAFNLLPIPALDGGRLMFLGYEAAMRRRPNARVEAQVHAIGLVMMLALMLVVTVVSDIPRRY